MTSLAFNGNRSESLRKEELPKNSSHHRSEIPARNVSHVRYNNGLNNQSVSSDDESASVNLVPNNTGANAARSDHNKEGSVDRLEHSSYCDFDLIRDGLNDDVGIYSTACFSEEQDTECQNGEESMQVRILKHQKMLFILKKMMQISYSSLVEMKNEIRTTLIVWMMSQIIDQNLQTVRVTLILCLFLTIHLAG